MGYLSQKNKKTEQINTTNSNSKQTSTMNFQFKDQVALQKLIKQMQTERPQSAIKIESERRQLAEDFVPGPYDVICAR
jgi:hypothetical protein